MPKSQPEVYGPIVGVCKNNECLHMLMLNRGRSVEMNCYRHAPHLNHIIVSCPQCRSTNRLFLIELVSDDGGSVADTMSWVFAHSRVQRRDRAYPSFRVVRRFQQELGVTGLVPRSGVDIDQETAAFAAKIPDLPFPPKKPKAP